jgi:hypothetical protein
MSTLDTKPDTTRQSRTQNAPAQTVGQPTDAAALITEQQVLFASAAALAPADVPVRRPNVAHNLAMAVRAMFVRTEKSHAPKHYPQRFAYLENSAMSRAMIRL